MTYKKPSTEELYFLNRSSQLFTIALGFMGLGYAVIGLKIAGGDLLILIGAIWFFGALVVNYWKFMQIRLKRLKENGKADKGIFSVLDFFGLNHDY